MHRLARFLSYAIMAAFVVASALALRADLGQMSVAPLIRSRGLVLGLAAWGFEGLGLYTLRNRIVPAVAPW